MTVDKALIRSVFTLVLGILGTAVASVISLIMMLFDRRGKSVQFLMNKWAWFFLKLSGVKIEVNGLEN